MKADGTMARVPDLVAFCAEHGLKLCSVSDLIEYRRRHRSASWSASRPCACRHRGASSLRSATAS